MIEKDFWWICAFMHARNFVFVNSKPLKMCALQLYLLQHLYPSSQCEYHASFLKVPSSEYRQSYVTAWLPLRARCTSFCLSGSASKEITVKTFSVTEEIMEEEQYKYCISSATPQVFLQGLAADFILASVTSCRSICKPNIFVSFSFRSVNCIEHIFVDSLVWQYFT